MGGLCFFPCRNRRHLLARAKWNTCKAKRRPSAGRPNLWRFRVYLFRRRRRRRRLSSNFSLGHRHCDERSPPHARTHTQDSFVRWANPSAHRRRFDNRTPKVGPEACESNWTEPKRRHAKCSRILELVVVIAGRRRIDKNSIDK